MFSDIFVGLFGLVFCLVLGCFVVTIIRNLRQWHQNNASPQLDVEATVVSRRADVSLHQSANAGDISGAHGFSTMTSTDYYVTFQVKSGDRLEFHVSGVEYGQLVEGDTGTLTFQGTRYLGFVRTSAY